MARHVVPVHLYTIPYMIVPSAPLAASTIRPARPARRLCTVQTMPTQWLPTLTVRIASANVLPTGMASRVTYALTRTTACWAAQSVCWGAWVTPNAKRAMSRVIATATPSRRRAQRTGRPAPAPHSLPTSAGPRTPQRAGAYAQRKTLRGSGVTARAGSSDAPGSPVVVLTDGGSRGTQGTTVVGAAVVSMVFLARTAARALRGMITVMVNVHAVPKDGTGTHTAANARRSSTGTVVNSTYGLGRLCRHPTRARASASASWGTINRNPPPAMGAPMRMLILKRSRHQRSRSVQTAL